MNKGLGRAYIPDERDKNYPLRSLLREAPKTDIKYHWANGWWGDQGRTSECVAYSWLHWLADGPVTQKNVIINQQEANKLYKEAQKVDEWPGEQYDGTSVRAMAKIFQALGYISEYYWTSDANVMANTILTIGPVVIGVNWYESMFYPDKKGLIKIEGRSLGGHAVKVDGVNMKKGLFRIKNSWGKAWGKNGYCFISFADMQRLLDEHGECCLAVEVKKMDSSNIPIQ